MLTILIFDWRTPLGHAVGIGYLVPLILAGRSASPRVVRVVASVCSGLIVIGYFLAPPSIVPAAMVMLDRTVGIAVIWTMVKFLSGSTQEDQRLQTAFEAIPSGLLVADGMGNIVLVNAGLERMFGYTGDELIGQPVERLIPERYRGAHPSQRAVFFHSPSARPMGSGRDLYGLRKNGSEFPVEIGLNPMKTNTGMTILCSVIDITERKQVEERLRRQEVLHRVFEEREAVSRNLHDGILQSLYAIQLGLEHCRRLLTTPSQPVLPQMDARIEDVGLVIAEVRDFMTGQDPPWACTLDLRAGIEEILQLHRVGERPVLGLHMVDPDSMVGLSREEIKHLLYIVREAISNAVRHASAESCHVTIASIEGRLQVRVEDDGAGFARRAEGNGRGFGNMEARARQIGAAIDIVSAPGRGTRITIAMARREIHVTS
ncbi:MAG: PAS domain S-box protein [Nitrospirae bacterium]|nr:PAS domain S-box protein [Nitrospirota bacterium]